MLRPIVRYGGAGLNQPAAPVTTFDESLDRLIDDMVDTMYAAPGIGLAAPQIGVPLRVCVIDLSVGKRGGELLTLVNPEFVERDGMQLEEEGCLSVPGFNATVARPARAVVRALDRTRQGARDRRHGPARPRAAARDRSPRRPAVPRSAARHSSATSSSGRFASSSAPDAGDAAARRSSSARRRSRCRRSSGCVGSPHEVVGVVTQPDRPRGRGQTGPAEAVKRARRRLEAPGPAARDDSRTRGGCDAIDALAPDLGVVAAYGRILPQALLDLPRLGMINVHASLLPRWRGAAPVHRAILAGDRTTGVTIMRVVLALDAGPMLAKPRPRFDPTRRAASSKAGSRRSAPISPGPRSTGWPRARSRKRRRTRREVTYAARLERRDSVIDWARPADVIHNQIRGLQPWPLAGVDAEGPPRDAAAVGRRRCRESRGRAGHRRGRRCGRVFGRRAAWRRPDSRDPGRGPRADDRRRFSTAVASPSAKRSRRFRSHRRDERAPGRRARAARRRARPDDARRASWSVSAASSTRTATARCSSSSPPARCAGATSSTPCWPRAATRRLTGVDAPVRATLRLGAYQLAHLDRMPAHAVVHESVELARELGRARADGLRQRRAATSGARPAAAGRARAAGAEGVAGQPAGLPHDHAVASRVARRALARPLRLRRGRALVSVQQRIARRHGAFARPAHADRGARGAGQGGRGGPAGAVGARRDPAAAGATGRLPAELVRELAIQDEASQIVAHAVGAEPGERVLDVCAAPGGKTLVIASDMRRRGLDRRCRSPCARASACSAPCSDRAGVEAPYRADRRDASAAVRAGLRRRAARRAVLGPRHAAPRSRPEVVAAAGGPRRVRGRAARHARGGAAVVRPGGRLVYATCSSEPEENEQVVAAFLAAHGGFAAVPAVPGPAVADGEQLVDDRGFLRTLPFRDGLDAFFAAVLVRRRAA